MPSFDVVVRAALHKDDNRTIPHSTTSTEYATLHAGMHSRGDIAGVPGAGFCVNDCIEGLRLVGMTCPPIFRLDAFVESQGSRRPLGCS